MMHKSASGAVDDERNGAPNRVISRLDVGQRVLVSSRFTGTLRYVGRVIGKDGIFCGVELDDPIGKHDGMHRNVSYFECHPLHGIFAPTYKVELAHASNSVDKSGIAFSSRRPDFQNLTRLTIPVITTSNRSAVTPVATVIDVMSSSTATASNELWNAGRFVHDPMNWSLMSGDSSMLSSGCSGNALGLCDDLMMNSNHTYVVTDSDYLMLNDIEINDSNLLHLDDDEDDYNNNNADKELVGSKQTESIILERPTMDSRLLPVIGFSSASESGDTVAEDDVTAGGEEEEETDTPIADAAECRLPGVVHTDNSSVLQTNHCDKTLSLTGMANRDSNDTPAFSSLLSSTTPIKQADVDMLKTTEASKLSRVTNCTTRKSSASKSKKSSISTDVPKRERPPKKPRVSLMEMLQQSTIPAVSRPPKPPSKSQLLMERIKASIEADKSRPKKAVKSKVAETLQSATTEMSSSKDEPNAGINTNDVAEADNGRNVTSTATTDDNVEKQENMVVIPAKNTTFSRSVSGLSGKSSTPTRVTSSSTACNKGTPLVPLNNGRIGSTCSVITTPVSQRSTTPRSSALTRPRESVAAHRSMLAATVTTARTPLKAKQIQPTFNGTHSTPASDKNSSGKPLSAVVPRVQAVPVAQLSKPRHIAAKTLTAATKAPTLSRRSSLERGLCRQLAWNAKAVDVLLIVQRREYEDAQRKHLRQLELVRADYAKELAEKCSKLSDKLEDVERIRTELAEHLAQSQDDQVTLQCRHAEERAAFVLRVEEAESSLEIAMAAKHELELTMAKDDNEKIQKLSNDISGLNFILQQKTEEVRKLRADNFRLQGEVDTLQQTKIEVQKLQNRLDESKEQLKRQQIIQKDLVQQLERCREEAQNSMHISRITEQENEVLKYKIQHITEFTPLAVNGDEDDMKAISPHSSCKSLHCSTPLSSRMVSNGAQRMPERRNSGGSRPNSTSAIVNEMMQNDFRLSSRSQISENSNFVNVMHKSFDASGISALSVFQSQGRSGRAVKNTPTKIYAPEGTFEIRDSDVAEKNAHFTNDNRIAENDSSSNRGMSKEETGTSDKVTCYVDCDVTAESVA